MIIFHCLFNFNLFLILDNEKCAPQDPPIGNIDSLINKACTMYHYGKSSFFLSYLRR